MYTDTDWICECKFNHSRRYTAIHIDFLNRSAIAVEQPVKFSNNYSQNPIDINYNSNCIKEFKSNVRDIINN